MSLRSLRPTLLDRYIAREIVPPMLLGLLLFSFILLLQQITLLMGVLISRGADLPTIARIFLNYLPSILATTIPMAFLLGVLLAFGRLAADSEIVALRASGVSPGRLLRPIFLLATVAAGATFYIMAVRLPAANQAYREIFYSLIVSKARTAVTPRVFTDDLVPGMVLYVSDVSAETGEWRNLFLHDVRIPQKPRVILARGGRLVIDDAHKAVEMHLEQGIIHSFDPATPGKDEVERFKSGDFPLPFEELFPKVPISKGDREMTLEELSQKSHERVAAGKPSEALPYDVEWWKKFAIPAACFVFGLLGLGLSLGSKKEARSAAFALSIGIIFVYYVIITLGERAGDTGMISPFLSMWGANIVLGLIALALLAMNYREAAFDPLDPGNYTRWLPRIRRGRPGAGARPPGRKGSRQPVVVLRIPRLSVRFPSILDRYIARNYFGQLCLVLTAFWSIFVLVDFIQLFDEIQMNHVKGVVVVRYYTYFSPFIIHMMVPVACLVCVLITFGVLSRRNEITAMKAGGISLYRAIVPVLAMGSLCTMGMFALAEYVLPRTNRVVDQDRNVIKGRPPQSSSNVEHRWILGSDGRIYNYDYLGEGPGPVGAPRGQVAFYGLSVYDVDAKTWDLRDRLYASHATWNGLGYDLERGWRRTFGDRPSFHAFDAARTREIEPPGYFKRDEPASDTLRFRELADHIHSLEALGLDVVKLRVQLHRKLSFPAVSLVMTLIGVPFAFVVGRRGALYGIGLSILLAIVYWFVFEIFAALGNNALLHPALAAWAPNLIFGAAALYMLFALET